MALISDKDQATLRGLFADRLTNDISITGFVPRESHSAAADAPRHAHSGAETRQVLTELAALTDRLRVEILDFAEESPEARAAGVTRAPALILHGRAKGQVRFFGLPSGYEFSTLIEDILAVSSGETSLSDDTRLALAAVDQPLHVQVFGTPT